jgi:hypothetical protein
MRVRCVPHRACVCVCVCVCCRAWRGIQRFLSRTRGVCWEREARGPACRAVPSRREWFHLLAEAVQPTPPRGSSEKTQYCARHTMNGQPQALTGKQVEGAPGPLQKGKCIASARAKAVHEGESLCVERLWLHEHEARALLHRTFARRMQGSASQCPVAPSGAPALHAAAKAH